MDVMDGFSPAGVTSLALTVQHRAFAAAEELAHHEHTPELAEALNPLGEQIEQLGQLSTALHLALDARPSMTPRLQQCLNQYFSSCDPSLAALTKQLMRLQPGLLHDVNWHFLSSQQALLKAYNDVFAYLEDILLVEDRDGQDASLNAPRGRFIMETAHRTIRTAAQTNSILLSGGLEPPSEKDAPAYTPPSSSGKSPAVTEAEAPPPYEPLSPTGPAPAPLSPPSFLSPRSRDRASSTSSRPRTPNLPRIDGPYSHTLSPAELSLVNPDQAGPSQSGSSQAGSSQTGSSTGSGWDKPSLSSLTRSFRALTSSLRSKPDPLVSALCQAVTNGDVQQVAGLLKHGASTSGRDENGDTPLHCAIRADQGPAAELLLNVGADVTGSGWSKMPPLFFAASLGSLNVARAILQKGARVDQRNTSGQPYFVDVVAGGNLVGINFLMENGANPDCSSISGRPVIVLAAKKNNLALVKMLIDFGAKVNVTDMTGGSLLSVAATKGDPAMVDLLLEHGADPNGRTVNGTAVMIEAIQKGKADLAIKLLQAGADPNAWDLTGQAAIIPALKDNRASAEKKLELVRTLLQAGADVHATTLGGSIPCIWLAVESGSLEMTELLLRHGANPSAMRQDVTLLMHAVEKDETALAKLLIKSGADVNLADKKGRTPLLVALTKQNLDMVTLLVAKGARADLKDQQPTAELSKALSNSDIAAALGMSVARDTSQQQGTRKLLKQTSN
ncbi:hypothetical protein NLU13_0995 [Sarocladium strictum]|uniref:Ankyrin repeat protein n=1 Tax=Sarocladium strictum TaxID=5046 RepID=A0AA39GS15_SARSR|nr:hypothetical protein NLU13_0995 [Sarocladium strictum]